MPQGESPCQQPETALRFLESYLSVVRSALHPQSECPALFPDDGGHRMPYYTLRRIVLKTGEQADLKEPLTAHVFRRSCTSELVRGNANIYHVSRMLGHESLETLQHYVRLNITDIQEIHKRTHPRERDEKEERGE